MNIEEVRAFNRKVTHCDKSDVKALALAKWRQIINDGGDIKHYIQCSYCSLNDDHCSSCPLHDQGTNCCHEFMMWCNDLSIETAQAMYDKIEALV